MKTPHLDSNPALRQARAHRAAGRLGKAEKAYRQALRKVGVPAATELAELLRELGRNADALQVLAPIVGQPDTPPATHELAVDVARKAGRLDVAIRAAHAATTVDDATARAWFLRGRVEISLADTLTAEKSLARAVELDPDSLEYRGLLADAQVGRGTFPIPTEHAQAMVDLAPRDARNHARLGTALRFNDELDAAMNCFDTALSLDRSCADAIAGRAQILEQLGRTEEAMDLVRPWAYRQEPSFLVTGAWVRLCRRKKNWNDAESAIRKYLTSSRGTPLHRANLEIQLGQVLEKQGRYDEAFATWKAGNAVHKGRWNRAAHEQLVDALIDTFNAEAMRTLPRSTCTTDRPIFVMGMYRSGTTLTEQVLSAHGSIAAGGESGGMTHCAGELGDALGGRDHWPTNVTSVTTELLDSAGERYLDTIAEIADSDAPHFTDKMPMNYLNVGLISLMFPGARIIHCLRDPLDTCLSCYGNAFASRMAYTSDLSDLGHAYRQYLRLMDHWSGVETVPIHPLRYEELVSDPEPVLRSVMDFLGLDWAPELLRFHESARVAATPSMDQVREPLYTGSIGRAGHYIAHLGDLEAALNGD